MTHPKNLKAKYPLLFKEESNNNIEQKRQRCQLAWDEARKAAAILKKEFGARKVFVFGSLVDPSKFDENSDIDLAVVGVPEERFYAAVGAVIQSVKGFKIDLLDAEDCKESLHKAIERDGVEI